MKHWVTLAAAALVWSILPARAADAPANNAPPTQPAAAQPAAKQHKAPTLKRAEVDALLAKPEQVLIIDLRRPDELTTVGGFPVYLSIQSKDLESRLPFIPKDRAIITVSNHSGRSGAAADLLVDRGYRVAGIVGVKDYEAEGGALVKIAPPPPKQASASLQAASAALGVENTKSIEIEAAGQWFQFGQAPIPGQAWPQFDVSAYNARISYEPASASVKIVRKQTIDPTRPRPVPVEQRVEQVVSGGDAWNIAAPPASAAAGTPPTVTPQTAAVDERLAEIWATPQGFLRAALANKAEAKAAGNGAEISFTVDGKRRFEGVVNAQNQVERVKTWIDNPVLGDTLVESVFSDYKDFGGVQFPSHITRSQGGYLILDLTVSSVKANPQFDITVPGVIATQRPSPVAVSNLAPGVLYLTGGTHHSVAIEQKDHVVLVEAPLNEERSLALIAKLGEVIPNKPIKYVVNTHAHFDHSGGLRTFVAKGAAVVTHELAKAYYEKVWANPHTIKQDELAKQAKTAQFESVTDKKVIGEGDLHKIEVYRIAGNSHSDDLALIYLPGEKVLIEADAYTPPAAGAPVPTSPNPYSVNLHENVQKLNLNVEKIAALHGQRVVTLADLRSYIGQPTQ